MLLTQNLKFSQNRIVVLNKITDKKKKRSHCISLKLSIMFCKSLQAQETEKTKNIRITVKDVHLAPIFKKMVVWWNTYIFSL